MTHDCEGQHAVRVPVGEQGGIIQCGRMGLYVDGAAGTDMSEAMARFICESAGPCIRGYTVGMEIEEIQGMSIAVLAHYAAGMIGGVSWLIN